MKISDQIMTESQVHHMSHVQVKRVLRVLSLYSRHVYNYKIHEYYYVCKMVASMYAAIETHEQIFH